MPILVNIVEKDRVGNYKCKNIKNSKNKIIEILAKSKNRNLLKFIFRNLSKFKKVQSLITIEKLNFLTLSAKMVFAKLM